MSVPFTFVMLDVGGGEGEKLEEEDEEEEEDEGIPEEVLVWLLCLLLLL